MKTLYVEDNDFSRKLAKATFGVAGLDIDTTSSARRALARIAKNKYDLVVTDLMMPEESGLDLCRILKEKYPDLPVVMCSAVPELYKFEDYKALDNVIGFHRKPLTPEVVEQYIAGLSKSDIM